MKRSKKTRTEWQEEVWRIKEELSVKARKMGLRKYLAFVESEADEILKTRSKPAAALAREKHSTPHRVQ